MFGRKKPEPINLSGLPQTFEGQLFSIAGFLSSMGIKRISMEVIRETPTHSTLDISGVWGITDFKIISTMKTNIEPNTISQRG